MNVFIERVVSKFRIIDPNLSSAEDFIFQIPGMNEYVYGEQFLFSFAYVQQQFFKKEKIALILYKRLKKSEEHVAPEPRELPFNLPSI